MNCIQNKFSLTALSTPAGTPPDRPLILSPKNKRNGSASYWKEKFDHAQLLIKEMVEKSIELLEISGLLTMKRVKPNLEKTSVKVMQVHSGV